MVARYSGWPEVGKLSVSTQLLVKHLLEMFLIFCIPTELSSDGGPEFTASEKQKFLKDWGMFHCCSLVTYPHFNFRAEVEVMTANRLIMENTRPNRGVDLPTFQRVILQYHNMLTVLGNLSPAMIVFGRQVQDFIVVKPDKHEPYYTRTETATNIEMALMDRHNREIEALLPHTKKLPPKRLVTLSGSRTNSATCTGSVNTLDWR
jgi:hypothetical protein